MIPNEIDSKLTAYVRELHQRIAALERELKETVGALQEILKNLKGNKIVHSTLVGETLRASEVARDNVKFLTAKNQEYANVIDAIRLEMHGFEDENKKLEQELAEARESEGSLSDYSISLQRVVEAICNNHPIAEADAKRTPHHTEMARKSMQERDRLRLKWNTGKPSENGWYWLKYKIGIGIRHINLNEISDSILYETGEWAGPIPEPEEGE